MKAAIFDLDGTLLDSMKMWSRVGSVFLQGKGIETPADLAESVGQLTLMEAAAYFSSRFPLGMNPDEILQAWTEYIALQYRKEIILKPSVKEYIYRLRQNGIKMCVATLTDRPHVLAALERLEILDCMEFILTSSEVGKSKRSPDIYLRAAELLEVPIRDCVVFEDVLYAAKTAKKAGFTVYGVYDEDAAPDQEEMQKVCDKYITNFEELL